MNDSERNGLQEIVDKAIEEMAREAGDSFDIDRMNLAEFTRRTGLPRSKARTLKAKGFVVAPHGRWGMYAKGFVAVPCGRCDMKAKGFVVPSHDRCGTKAEATVISGFEGVVDALIMLCRVGGDEELYAMKHSEVYTTCHLTKTTPKSVFRAIPQPDV